MSNSSNKKIMGINPPQYIVKSNKDIKPGIYCDTCTELEGKCGCYSKSQLRGNKKQNK